MQYVIMLSQYSSIFHEFLRNGILGKHSLLLRVIICATNKLHKVKYLRKRLSPESVCLEHIVVFLLSPLGWVEPLLLAEKLLWKPICAVSLCHSIFLRHALSLKNLNSSETDILFKCTCNTLQERSHARPQNKPY